MPRSITNIVQEGGGYRITWSDGAVDQLIWSVVDGKIALRKDYSALLTGSEVEEIVDSLTVCAISASLTNKLSGVGQIVSQALALDQVGDAVVQNTWTRMLYDTSLYARDDTGGVSGVSGRITLPYGVYLISVTVLLHDTAVTTSDAALQIYDEDNEQEYLGTFAVHNRIGLANAPMLVRTSGIIEVSTTTCDVTRTFSLRARSSSTTAVLGAHANSIPASSTNFASGYVAHRIG